MIDVDELIALTVALVGAPSENPGGTEAEAVGVLEKACQKAGFTVSTQEVAPGRPNLVATLPGGDGPGLMFLGHSDVVPAGPGWSGDPYRARVVDGTILGRGSTDMKGGLAAVVAAMSALSRSGAILSGPVTLVCTVDEEEHGAGVRDFVRRPSGEYLGCVVAEPTGLTVVRGCRGASYIEVDITGRAAHSGRPDDGASAIYAAAAIVDLIRADHVAMVGSAQGLLGSGTWNVGTIAGGQGISVVAPMASLGIDRRLMPDEDAHDIAAWLRTRIHDAGIDTGGIGVEVKVTMEMPGFETPADHRLVTTAVDTMSAIGAPTTVGGWTAACDGGFISRDKGIPAIVFGPGEINTQAHQPDEMVRIADLRTAATAYALMAQDLLG
ncbi:M20 family metallopeptidase [Gordonia sp. VNK1]|uniref:M20 family metallopeptidase n=1 Tax=Gordonia oleivorans TaxID=3156618 RepID=UPI0032B32CC4